LLIVAGVLLFGGDGASAQPGALRISAGGPYSGQVGDNIVFMSQFDLGGRPPDTAIAIEWDFGDGSTDMGQTTAHVYTRPGTYTVTVTLFVLAGREMATDSTTAQISAAGPTLSANAGGPYTGVAGQPVTMSGTASPLPADTAVNFNWTFGDGNSGTGRTVNHTYSAAGMYTVTLSVSVPAAGQQATATTTAMISAGQPQQDQVPLLTGCSNQALTWPVGTPMGTVANAVSPPGVVLSIFRLDPVQQRFRGFSPTAPSLANDYTMVETSLEAVFFCLSAPGMLFRPAPGGGSTTPTPNLVGPVYRWQETLLNDDSRFVPSDPSRYTLQLMPDGSAAAQVDCNRAMGSYTLSGNQLSLSFLVTTLAACPPGSLSD
jgi:PKD repeat protein